MTHVITFDTLAYANKLKNAGMEQKLAETQAEMQAQLLANLMDDQLAPKKDITTLEAKVDGLENRLLIKLGSLMIVCISLLATLITILHVH